MTAESLSAPSPSAESYGLRPQALTPLETLGQSVANIAPTATPTVVIPLVFAAAGAGTWFAYLFALVGVLLVSYSINQFARRSASPGSLYSYIATGLGPNWGLAAGWTLLIAYIGCASSVTSGFANYANVFVKDVFHLQSDLSAPLLVVLILISVVGAWYVAWKDIKLSARLTLGLELTSVAFILVVVVATLIRLGFHIDWSQLKLEGLTLDSLRLGLVLAIFSFTGFESAAALGAEAKAPLRTIPRAVWQSALLVGVLFVVSSYAQVAGFAGAGPNEVTLDKSDAPLQVLASRAGIGFFGIVITIGAIFSFFACVLASINAGARILFLLGRHGVFHASVGKAHETNATPHVAVTIAAVLAFLPAAFLAARGNGLFDIYGWVGTTATLGFILAYIGVSVAAPVYLYRLGELKIRHVVISGVGILFLVTALVGAVTPWPDSPGDLPIYAFLVLLLIGGLWGVVLHVRAPKVRGAIGDHVIALQARAQEASGA
jgi:amino acid transporter